MLTKFPSDKVNVTKNAHFFLSRAPTHHSFTFHLLLLLIIRSSRTEVFCKKVILRNFKKFTGKHLCQSLFFNKVAGSTYNFIKKETLEQVFSCEFCEISKNTFFCRAPPVAASQ